MTIVDSVQAFDYAMKQWYNLDGQLSEIDRILHLPFNTCQDLLYCFGLVRMDGRPESDVPIEKCKRVIIFAIVLKHHLRVG